MTYQDAVGFLLLQALTVLGIYYGLQLILLSKLLGSPYIN